MHGLDLFSGIGGITKALEGYVRPLAYCENDRYAQSVLLSRMSTGDLPIAPIWDDVKTITKTHFAPPSPPIDIIYGGFPCQDISVAGLGKGLDGERSGLFFEIVRLIGEIRPQFVFLENVAAITVRGSERVVGELCQLGYDSRWGVLSASDVGAPHQRERWWLLANAMSSGERRDERKEKIKSDVVAHSERLGCRPGADESGNGAEWRSHDKSRHCGQIIPHANGSRLQTQRAEQYSARVVEYQRQNRWPVESDVLRVVNGLPDRVDRIKGLGNAVVPAQAREAFERLMGLK